MKVFIFRCRSRPEMLAGTRYETGSNLSGNQCSGGWLFAEVVDVKEERSTSRLGIDIDELQRRVRQHGYHVWKSGVAGRALVDSEITVAASPPPPLAIVGLEAPVAVAPPAEVMPVAEVAPPPAPDPPRRRAAPAVKASPAAPAAAVSGGKVAAAVSGGKAAAAPPRHQVVWFDIPVLDIDRAIRFYSAVLGVVLRKEQAGRGVALAVLPHTDSTIGGCLVQTMDARPSDGGPLIYLNADGRLDTAIAATKIAGGTVLQPKHSIGPEGYRAIVLDTEGNRIALHSR
jgi:uncharacterized protein